MDRRPRRTGHADLLAGRPLRLRLLPFTAETVVITVKDHQIVGRIPQETPFRPNIAVTPDAGQVWLTLKAVGKTMVFSGRLPLPLLKARRTGPTTNHLKVVRKSRGTVADATVGDLKQV